MQQGERMFVVVDGQKSPNFGGVFAESIQFSADGKHVAYAAERGAKRFVVVDGQSGPEFEGIVKGTLRMSLDGSHVAIVARKGEKLMQVVDGTPSPEYDKMEAAVFSEKGQHVAYVAGTDSERFAVVDGVVGPGFESIINDTLVFSADGGSVAYGALKDGKYRIMADGKAVGEYDGVGMPSFSPDGKHIVFRAGMGKQAFVFVDGTQVPSYAGIVCEPTFRKDGVLEFMTVEKGILYRVTSNAFLPTP